MKISWKQLIKCHKLFSKGFKNRHGCVDGNRQCLDEKFLKWI
jgi:hypothetical protein